MADTDYSNEIWKDIPGWEGIYQVSSLGRVRSLDRQSRLTTPNGLEAEMTRRGRVLKQRLGRDGYRYVELMAGGRKGRSSRGVHRLVCAAFHGPSDLHVAHSDGTRTNNRPENLRWATRVENEADKLRHGRKRGMQKLTAEEVKAIRRSQERTAVLVERYKVTQVTIDRIRRGAGWRHIE